MEDKIIWIPNSGKCCHICNDVRWSQGDYGAETELRDFEESKSTSVNDKAQEDKMREDDEEEVKDNTQVSFTKKENKRDIDWG